MIIIIENTSQKTGQLKFLKNFFKNVNAEEPDSKIKHQKIRCT